MQPTGTLSLARRKQNRFQSPIANHMRTTKALLILNDRDQKQKEQSFSVRENGQSEKCCKGSMKFRGGGVLYYAIGRRHFARAFELAHHAKSSFTEQGTQAVGALLLSDPMDCSLPGSCAHDFRVEFSEKNQKVFLTTLTLHIFMGYSYLVFAILVNLFLSSVFLICKMPIKYLEKWKT